jgi:hypothetical protein
MKPDAEVTGRIEVGGDGLVGSEAVGSEEVGKVVEADFMMVDWETRMCRGLRRCTTKCADIHDRNTSRPTCEISFEVARKGTFSTSSNSAKT